MKSVDKDIESIQVTVSLLRELLFTLVFPVVCFLIVSQLPDYFVLSESTTRTPVAHAYLPTILFLSIVSIVSYWVSKLSYRRLSPLFKVLTSVGMLQGVFLGILMTLQVSTNIFAIIGFSFARFPFTLIALILLFIPLAPAIIVYLLIYQLLYVHKDVAHKIKHKKALSDITLVFILLIPFFAIEDILLMLFGQKPDSTLLAFAETCSFLLSNHPCNISSAGHYLCTAASNGHTGLVRPVRYGMRGGGVILVNRQLLVANAFENWLEENAPVFHKIVRSNYDKYGIPLYRLINNVWISDLVYILMKPLELFFVAWLYLFDRNPEDRIASQYLPNSDWLKTESLLQ